MMTPSEIELQFDVAAHTVLDTMQHVNKPRLEWLKKLLEVEVLARGPDWLECEQKPEDTQAA